MCVWPIATCAGAWGSREDWNEPTPSGRAGIVTVRARAEPLGQGVNGDDRGVSICYPQPAARVVALRPVRPSACHPRNQGGHGHCVSPDHTQSEPRHGVGCPRQACLARRPQRRVLSNAMSSSASPGTAAREGRVDSASQRWLLQALAEGWNAIRARHEELPPVILVIGPSPRPAATRIELGHFAPMRWSPWRDSHLSARSDCLAAFTTAIQEGDRAGAMQALAASSDALLREARQLSADASAVMSEVLITVDGLAGSPVEIFATLLPKPSMPSHSSAGSRTPAGRADTTTRDFERSPRSSASRRAATYPSAGHRRRWRLGRPRSIARRFARSPRLLAIIATIRRHSATHGLAGTR